MVSAKPHKESASIRKSTPSAQTQAAGCTPRASQDRAAGNSGCGDRRSRRGPHRLTPPGRGRSLRRRPVSPRDRRRRTRGLSSLARAADAVGFHQTTAPNVGVVENLPADTTLLPGSPSLLSVGTPGAGFLPSHADRGARASFRFQGADGPPRVLRHVVPALPGRGAASHEAFHRAAGGTLCLHVCERRQRGCGERLCIPSLVRASLADASGSRGPHGQFFTGRRSRARDRSVRRGAVSDVLYCRCQRTHRVAW